ncbi:MAG: DNA polymerase III subunit gamma/tau [Chlamydiota bacterium]
MIPQQPLSVYLQCNRLLIESQASIMGKSMASPNTYKSIARTFRPQKFSDVLGQEPIVTTLRNALLDNQLAHAYLFAGSRGSGKTTLARILAKALCCQKKEEIEPCCACSCCLEIQSGKSLDVIEIDGASHRGIDDIRALSETTIYAPSHAKWKIYIIDEVHMLTKEAFNALLKTLEEPPPQVKFLFATTEPHKILPTILSRCQRFDLARIAPNVSEKKLAQIAVSLGREITPQALSLITKRAEGSLRDAESLLEQLFSYASGSIEEDTVIDALGMTRQEDFALLDQAVLEENDAFAFSFSDRLVENGKDLNYFLEQLFLHFRAHFVCLLEKKSSSYTKDLLFWVFDLIVDTQRTFAKTPNQKLALEMLLLQILRAKKRVSLPSLLSRLEEIHRSIVAREEKIEAPRNNQAAEIAEKDSPVKKELVPIPFGEKNTETPSSPSLEKKVVYDTLLRFSSVVLEGRIEQN